MAASTSNGRGGARTLHRDFASGEISYLKAVSKAPMDEGPLELAKLDVLIDWLLYGRYGV